MPRETVILNELFRDYLRFNGYENTLSVFLSETGQPPEPALDRAFLKRELGVDEFLPPRAASTARSDAGESNLGEAGIGDVPLVYSLVAGYVKAKEMQRTLAPLVARAGSLPHQHYYFQEGQQRPVPTRHEYHQGSTPPTHSQPSFVEQNHQAPPAGPSSFRSGGHHHHESSPFEPLRTAELRGTASTAGGNLLRSDAGSDSGMGHSSGGSVGAHWSSGRPSPAGSSGSGGSGGSRVVGSGMAASGSPQQPESRPGSTRPLQGDSQSCDGPTPRNGEPAAAAEAAAGGGEASAGAGGVSVALAPLLQGGGDSHSRTPPLSVAP